MNKTRTIFIVILVLMIVLAGVAIVFSVTKDDRSANKLLGNSSKEADEIDSKHMRDFKIIDVDKYLELYNSDKTRVIIIGRTGCEYCSIAEPILKNISYEYEVDFYYLSIDTFSDDDGTKFLESDEYFKEKGGVNTPTILIVNKGIVDMNVGLDDTEGYEKFFKDNNII